MNTVLNIFILFALLKVSISKAQFEGFNSFTDPILQRQLKIKRVRTVSEAYIKAKYVGSLDTITFFGGSYTFDSEGRFIEHLSSFGERTKREYNENGLVSKCYYFDKKDTTKLDYWTATDYDKNGRIVRNITGIFENGNLRIKVNSESKILTDKDGKTRAETHEYYNGKLFAMVYSRDSVSDIYRFTIDCRYPTQDDKKENEKQDEKTLVREYFSKNAYYADKVEYVLKGQMEFVKEIKSRFDQKDAKGRVLEYGTIDYEEAGDLYFDQHPEEIAYIMKRLYPPGLINGILNNKITGKRKVEVKNVYDGKGLLIEKYYYGTTYKFKYNNQGQMIEQYSRSGTNTRRILYYNKIGLVSKMVTIQSNSEKAIGAEEKVEFNYTYTYY